MKIENVSWESDAIKITGEIYLPPPSAAPRPGLLLCHGIPAGVKAPDDRGYPLLAERFCREGFGVLIFNFRGCGSSGGNFDLPGWTRDLKAGLDFFASRRVVNPRRTFLMGFSAGAAVSICVAAERKDVAGVVSCASPADFDDLVGGTGAADFLARAREVGIVRDPSFPGSFEEWKKGFEEVKPIDCIEKIPSRPLLLIHGGRDDVVEKGHAERLYAKVRNASELFLIDDADHRLRLNERAMDKALEWLKDKT